MSLSNYRIFDKILFPADLLRKVMVVARKEGRKVGIHVRRHRSLRPCNLEAAIGMMYE